MTIGESVMIHVPRYQRPMSGVPQGVSALQQRHGQRGVITAINEPPWPAACIVFPDGGEVWAWPHEFRAITGAQLPLPV